MCGIALVCIGDDALSGNGMSAQEPALPTLLAALRARGPDFLGVKTVVVPSAACRLHFIASLLQLRGLQPEITPCLSEQGHILCFNGEVFGGLEVAPGQNDGSCLLAALADMEADADASSVPQVISRLRGPWAVMFWDPFRQQLWFGRDVLGRRSLLVHFPDAADPRLLLSSVSELPPPGNGAATAGEDVASVVGEPVSMGRKHTGGAGAIGQVPDGLDGGGNSSGRGGGGDAEGDDAEPRGSDGYWTELPPGLYSISFPPSPAVTPAAAVQAADADAASRAADEAPVAPAAVAFRRLAVGGSDLLVERHAWRDPMLLELESYYRTESAPAAAPAAAGEAGRSAVTGPAGAAAPKTTCAEGAAVADVDGSAAAPAAAASAALAAVARNDPKAASGGFGQMVDELPQSLVPAAPGVSVPTSPPRALLLAQPGRCPAARSPVEELARALLTALTAAMHVRCGCIATRSPHPSAAFAAAARAAAAATAAATAATASCSALQPSWRRDDPLDFSLVTANAATTTDATTPSGPLQNAAPAPVAAACPEDGGNGGDGGNSVPWVTAATAGGASNSTCDAVAHSGAAAEAAAGPSCRTWIGPPGQRTSAAHPSPPAPLMILFSGGVDSVLLAALAHRVLPPEVPIDLSNVCFSGSCGGPPSPDRDAARDALEELAAACPGRRWRLVEVDSSLEDVDRHRPRLLALLRPALTVMDLNIGAALWLAASGQGTLRLPTAATSAFTPAAASTASASEPHQPPPSRPVAALSSSTPAAASDGDFYGSAARVVLLGHGADEQCAGYGRHRTRFRSGGWTGLSEELEVDVRRLWLRNLGRDDRLVADWGREGRHPFLDEAVMQLLLRARLDHICDLRLAPGRGDKAALRAALALLGLPRAAARVKRAIQFGSRIGKLSNTREFGSNRAANRQNAGGVALQGLKVAAASEHSSGGKGDEERGGAASNAVEHQA